MADQTLTTARPDAPTAALSARSMSSTAANAVTSEALRHPGPKTLLVVGTGRAVLKRVFDMLMPADRVLVWAPDAVGAALLRKAIRDHWPRLSGRTTVLESMADGLPDSATVDAVIVSRPVSDVPDVVERCRALLGADGVLSFAAPLRVGGDNALPEAVAAHAVRTDLVVRGVPPLRIHHLRFGAPEPELVDLLAPVQSPSHVAVTRRMGIDSNGVAAAGILGGVAALTKLVRPRSRAWMVPALAALPVAAFFRDPRRITPDDPRAVVAAADGVVLSVERMADERFGPGEWLRIAVFLSVLDVHVNRSPVAGRVVEILREEGGYAVAQSAAAEHNVACYTVLETAHGRVVVAQRTGLIARRIVNRARVGTVLAKGERYGLIRFGSRTDVYLPASAAEPLVAAGDRVVGGETVLAEWTA
ncbi:MAG TPA: phosphatidylserine decarboxylase [Cryptosporangiaceae bacterium]|nr:phosphatidylserine decarboxylase [Cryptosporangiaceae bacterium]